MRAIEELNFFACLDDEGELLPFDLLYPLKHKKMCTLKEQLLGLIR